ncbi:MAG: hypothetical protein ABSB70_02975 [Candidatus Velthaea sp.]|jgi:uncharacterized protein YbjT (DUF2867 family)
MNVAIFGAAGAIGRIALPELLGRGHRVRIVGRDAKKLAALTFSPLLREFVETYYLFTHPVVLDDALLRSVLPDVRKTLYDAAIAATVRALRAQQETVRV